jgi:hypothetical protein
MTTTHTPGPWEVRPSTREGNGSQWRDIVSLGGAFTPAYVGEAIEVDARLIAAAPELAEALRLALDTIASLHGHYCPDCKGGCPDLEAIQIGRAAIAKAEGLA